MNINPMNPSSWNAHVSASSSVDTGAGGGGGAYAGSGGTGKENIDEVCFETKEKNEEMEDLTSAGLIAMIKEFFLSLWKNFLKIFNFNNVN